MKLTDKWPTDTPIIIVVSSTGAGDPPENTVRFWRLFKKYPPRFPSSLSSSAHPLFRIEQNTLMEGVRFAVLGLGDTNYDSYQRFPNDITAKLLELGAREFYGRGKADDGTGCGSICDFSE